MIEKFITIIKGIGLLHNALPSGALALKKINAIYIENGTRKVDICSYVSFVVHR
jgi:hypothetical protein